MICDQTPKRNRKVVSLDFQEVWRILVEVPETATETELKQVATFLRNRGVLASGDGTLALSIHDSQDTMPDIHAIRGSDGQLRVESMPHTAKPLITRGDIHCQLVEYFGDRETLKFTTVLVEFPDGSIAHGTIYFRQAFAVVVACLEEQVHCGVFFVDEPAYPVYRGTSVLPWELVTPYDIEEGAKSIAEHLQDVTGEFAEAAETLAITEPEWPPHMTLVRVQACMAENPDELCYRTFKFGKSTT